jgi:hypothetical protein
MGTCASQQSTEQKESPVRVRLQVDTLQTQYALVNGISFLQVLQRFQNVGSIVIPRSAEFWGCAHPGAR